MRPDSAKYLYDILQAADSIAQFTAGCDLKRYAGDPLRRSAVERQFEIVGEALAQLSRRDPETAAHVTERARIIAFRNILIHGYAQVDSRLVWDVVTTDLPVLRREVAALLADSTENVGTE
jgi:uncharacterized protein with HEPN domain